MELMNTHLDTQEVRFDSSAIFAVQKRLAATGTLWRLLLDYPLEHGISSAFLPATFELSRPICFDSDCLSTNNVESKQRRAQEALIVASHLTGSPDNIAVFHWFRPRPGFPVPGSAFEIAQTYRFSDQENYFILRMRDGVVPDVEEIYGHVPDRPFYCLLTRSDVALPSNYSLSLSELEQFAANCDSIFVSIFDHYARLIWARDARKAWTKQNRSDEVKRVGDGPYVFAVLDAVQAASYLHQRICATPWVDWMEALSKHRLPRAGMFVRKGDAALSIYRLDVRTPHDKGALEATNTFLSDWLRGSFNRYAVVVARPQDGSALQPEMPRIQMAWDSISPFNANVPRQVLTFACLRPDASNGLERQLDREPCVVFLEVQPELLELMRCERALPWVEMVTAITKSIRFMGFKIGSNNLLLVSGKADIAGVRIDA
jgi:hypothetical protein